MIRVFVVGNGWRRQWLIRRRRSRQSYEWTQYFAESHNTKKIASKDVKAALS